MSAGEDVSGQSLGLALLWKLSKHGLSVTNTVTSSQGSLEQWAQASIPAPWICWSCQLETHQHTPTSALTMSPPGLL